MMASDPGYVRRSVQRHGSTAMETQAAWERAVDLLEAEPAMAIRQLAIMTGVSRITASPMAWAVKAIRETGLDPAYVTWAEARRGTWVADEVRERMALGERPDVIGAILARHMRWKAAVQRRAQARERMRG